MQRYIIVYLILLLNIISLRAMDFGLRFKSHSYPLEQRTSISFGESPIRFDDELIIGFYYNFYTEPLFGAIATITTNDGNVISVMASHQEHDLFLLGLVVNEKIKLMDTYLSVDLSHEDKIDIILDKRLNSAVLRLNNKEIELPVDLSGTKSARVVFGIDQVNNITDVAPIELRNIRFFVDKKNTNMWDFKYHDTPTSRIDEISGVEAEVTNPHWLIDDHTDWQLLFSETVKDTRQTAFDPKTDRFYIVGNDKIKIWSPLSADSVEHDIKGGYRPMAYSNHLVFDTIAGSLINYSLSQQRIARFDDVESVWKVGHDVKSNEEASYANHAFALDGDAAYAFGGYGFYKFHNDLFKIDLPSGTISKCDLKPELTPATSAAAAVVGDKLYIFGGKGNPSGRQELPTKCMYSLYAYDMNTWQGELVWEIDSVPYDFLPSQSMYYDSLEDCFYAASTCHGGELIKISRTEPKISEISTHINTKMEYRDIVFDLFRSADLKHYYLLIDKRIDKHTHDYSIYGISAPFLENPDIIKNKVLTTPKAHNDDKSKLWIAIFAGFVVCGALIYIFLRRRKRQNVLTDSTDTPSPEDVNHHDNDAVNEQIAAHDPIEDVETDELDTTALPAAEIIPDTHPIEEVQANDAPFIFDKKNTGVSESMFDRSKSAISFLGAFCVRNKDGEDITAKFTDRLKSLLILLLLANSKSETGIKYQTIDEEIWGDKDEKSAQNNRNVYMRKLRILLEEVGDIPITYDKGYFKIDCSKVMYDYGLATSHINEVKASGNTSPELIDETLDLLLMGPLLPKTTYEWLDQYKADYSDRALEILNKLLKYEFSRNDELSFKIAQTISCHEALSEEAMKAKCILLSRKKMIGQAKKVYAKFCKEYALSLGEEYAVSFPDVCKSKI